MSLSTILIIIAGIVLFVILRGLSSMRMKHEGERAPQYSEPVTGSGAPPSSPDSHDWPEGWVGEHKGVEYTAESYDGENVIVAIHVDERLPVSMEINARNERPAIAESMLATEVNALISLGATYIDINYNTNWLAAELPTARIRVDRKTAERVVEHLLRIKEIASKPG